MMLFLRAVSVAAVLLWGAGLVMCLVGVVLREAVSTVQALWRLAHKEG